MVGIESVRKFKSLFEKAKKFFDEDTAKKVASVVVFNGDYGVFEINGEFYHIDVNAVRKIDVEEEPEVYYKDDGDGFLVVESGETAGFTMPQSEVTLIDYGLPTFKLALRFRYEFLNGKAVIRFADKRPHLIGKLVFYNGLTGWKLGKVEDITAVEAEDYIIAGVPVIDGEKRITPFVPVSVFGYPNDEHAVISLLKSDFEHLKEEYSTRENLQNLAETESFSLVVIERLMSYRDELLLWDIAESIIGSKGLDTPTRTAKRTELSRPLDGAL